MNNEMTIDGKFYISYRHITANATCKSVEVHGFKSAEDAREQLKLEGCHAVNPHAEEPMVYRYDVTEDGVHTLALILSELN